MSTTALLRGVSFRQPRKTDGVTEVDGNVQRVRTEEVVAGPYCGTRG